MKGDNKYHYLIFIWILHIWIFSSIFPLPLFHPMFFLSFFLYSLSLFLHCFPLDFLHFLPFLPSLSYLLYFPWSLFPHPPNYFLFFYPWIFPFSLICISPWHYPLPLKHCTYSFLSLLSLSLPSLAILFSVSLLLFSLLTYLFSLLHSLSFASPLLPTLTFFSCY